MFLGGNPGTRRGGGGALETTQLKRLGGETTAAVASVSASGDTTIYTPTAGKCVELRWIYAITDPQASASPVIKIKIGATEFYRGYAFSHWERFKGAPNDSLIINLSAGGTTVQVTAHLVEVDP